MPAIESASQTYEDPFHSSLRFLKISPIQSIQPSIILYEQPLLIPNHIPPPLIFPLQLMHRRIIQLMRPIVRLQFPRLALATGRFGTTTILMRKHTVLLYGRAVSRSLLYEPTLPDAEPDDARESEE